MSLIKLCLIFCLFCGLMIITFPINKVEEDCSCTIQKVYITGTVEYAKFPMYIVKDSICGVTSLTCDKYILPCAKVELEKTFYITKSGEVARVVTKIVN